MSDISFIDDDGPLPDYPADRRARGLNPAQAWWQEVNDYVYRNMPVSTQAVGAVGNGVADDTAALQAWIYANAGRSIIINGNHRISATIDLPANTKITFAPLAQIITAVANITLFRGNGKSGIEIYGGLFTKQTVGAVAYVAGIELFQCDRCVVDGARFEGMQWAGVLLNRSSRNRIRRINTGLFLGAIQDAADISIYEDSSYNEIENCNLNGLCAHGVLVQDPYSGRIPTKNSIRGIRVGSHTCYGFAFYLPGSGASDSHNHLSDSYAEDILGSFATNRDSGAGVYVVGDAAGGTIISGVTVRNTCVSTLTRSLAPGGFGISGINIGSTAPILADCISVGANQGDGFNCSSSPGGVTLDNCEAIIPATNNGTGPGGVGLRGSALRVENVGNFNCNGGFYWAKNAGAGCLVYANTVNVENPIFNGARIFCSDGTAFRTLVNAALINGLIGSNLNVRGLNAGSFAFDLTNVSGASLSNCTGAAPANPALYVNASTALRIQGGSYLSNGAIAVDTNGVCTDSLLDETAYFGGAASKMRNAATGFKVRCVLAAIPAAGTWAAGDHTERSVYAVGSPKGWGCTTAGAPGTHTSDGNY